MKFLEFKKYKKLVLPTKIALCLGIAGVLLTIIFGIRNEFVSKKSQTDKTYRIIIYKGNKHLGDNIFARVGGLSLPKWDDPLNQDETELIYYDKEEHTFLTRWGLPKSVQNIVNKYSILFSEVNLEAWKNIVASNEIKTNKYKGHQIQVDDTTVLRWEESAGDFYYRYAVVARVETINLYERLMFLSYDPVGKELKSAKLILKGLHGSKRAGQPDNVELFIGDNSYALQFGSLFLRNEEVLKIELNPEHLKISPTESNIFGIVVLPFNEEYPLPPPDSSYKKRGPSHFRDIEVGDTFLELEFK